MVIFQEGNSEGIKVIIGKMAVLNKITSKLNSVKISDEKPLLTRAEKGSRIRK